MGSPFDMFGSVANATPYGAAANAAGQIAQALSGGSSKSGDVKSDTAYNQSFGGNDMNVSFGSGSVTANRSDSPLAGVAAGMPSWTMPVVIGSVVILAAIVAFRALKTK